MVSADIERDEYEDIFIFAINKENITSNMTFSLP